MAAGRGVVCGAGNRDLRSCSSWRGGCTAEPLAAMGQPISAERRVPGSGAHAEGRTGANSFSSVPCASAD